MKRLGSYVFLAITLLVFVNNFTFPERAFAQSTLTHQSAQQLVTTQFDQVIAAANKELQEDSVLTTTAGKQRYTDAQILIPKTVAILQNAKSVYLASYDTSLSPAAAQAKALTAAETALNDTSAGIPTIFPQILQKLSGFGAVINTFRTQLRSAYAQANEVQNGNVAAPDLTNTNAVTTASQALTDAKSNKCTSIANSSIVDCIDAGVSWFIKNTLLKIAGFLVWFAANILNFSIQLGILNFKDWAPQALYSIWIVVRQIVSLFIVFAGLYLGFMYIIGREKGFEKFFPWLIMFALFVNFSYPLTRTLIDVSNVIALNVYSSSMGQDALTWSLNDVSSSSKPSPGAKIMENLGLQKLVDSANEPDKNGLADLVGSINGTAGALMVVAFVLYSAYVFFMAAGILIFRTATLVFLTIASPILFVDAVIPALGEWAVKMRKLFFEQLVVAPVFMIMLALTLKFLDVFSKAGILKTATGASLVTGGGNEIGVLFSVAMMLIMLHIALKVTRQISGEAGKSATNFMGHVGGFGLGVATGGAGILARGTLGKAAASARDAGWMDKLQGTRAGRGLYSLTNSLANSTYDARNVGAVSQGLTKAGMGGGAFGVSGSKGSTMTTDKLTEERSKALNKKYASIKDGKAREDYLKQKEGVGRWGRGVTGIKSDEKIAVDKIKEKEDELVKRYKARTDDGKKREYFESLPEDLQRRLKREGLDPDSVPATNAGTPSPSTASTAPTAGTGGTTSPQTTTPTQTVPVGSNRTTPPPNATPGTTAPPAATIPRAVPTTNIPAVQRPPTRSGAGTTAPPTSAAASNTNNVNTPAAFRRAGGEAQFRANFDQTGTTPPPADAGATATQTPPPQNPPTGATTAPPEVEPKPTFLMTNIEMMRYNSARKAAQEAAASGTTSPPVATQ